MINVQNSQTSDLTGLRQSLGMLKQQQQHTSKCLQCTDKGIIWTEPLVEHSMTLILKIRSKDYLYPELA